MIKLRISYTIIAVVAADLLATTGDSHMTWTSPVFPKLHSNDTTENPLGKIITSEEEAWMGSLINIGSIIGPFSFGYIAAKWGRKPALLMISIPHLISYLMLAFAENIYLYYAARFIGGLAVGGGYTVLPMYIAEIAEDSNRGMYSVTLNIFWCTGNLLPYCIGPYVSITVLCSILACLPVIFFVIFFLFGPESPYYLVSANKLDKAQDSLKTLRSVEKDSGVQKELEHIKDVLSKEKSGTIKDIFKSYALRKAFAISLILIMSQQLSGINAVLFYTQPIFQAVGNDIPDEISSIIIGLVLLASSFIAPFVADRGGRRIMLLVSLAGSAISLSLIGIFFYIQTKTELSTASIAFLPILGMVLYIISFNFGIGPIPWTLSSELFPNNVKRVSASAVSSVCWATSFLVTQFFNDMNDSMGKGETFWFFAGTCVLAAIFTYFVVPETKGKSFKEIQEGLEKK